ncbi:HTH_Tnp_Tc3_2 domain-containing protein [Trichonephila clavipes]|nr:HTH_Tnp_Tc3_2 domain-containing protein [Trichonephila clavipes]
MGSSNSLQPRFRTFGLLVVPKIEGDTESLTFFNGCRTSDSSVQIDMLSTGIFFHGQNEEMDRTIEPKCSSVTTKRNRRSTASDLFRQLSSATGTTLSRQTVYRRLAHIGLCARRPVRCVPLTATHLRLRLTWSREHALWTPQQWSCVMFSDESRFNLQPDSLRSFIWRVPGTRYHPKRTPLNGTDSVKQR